MSKKLLDFFKVVGKAKIYLIFMFIKCYNTKLMQLLIWLFNFEAYHWVTYNHDDKREYTVETR
jgi:hypothetical protein